MATTFDSGTVHTYSANTWAFSDVIAGADGKFYLAHKGDGGAAIEVLQWNGATWVEHASFTAVEAAATALSDDLDLAIDASGKLHIVFRPETGAGVTSDRGIAYGFFNGTDWTFSKIESASDPNGWKNFDDPGLAVDAQGVAHVVYKYSEAATHTDYLKYATNEGGTWSTQVLSTGTPGTGTGEIHDPWVGIGPDGLVKVTFVKEDDQNDVYGNLYFATKSPNGSFSAPTVVLDAVGEGLDYRGQSSMDAEGKIHNIFYEDVYDESGDLVSSTVYDYTNVSGAWEKQVVVMSTTSFVGGTAYQDTGSTDYLIVQEWDADFAMTGARIYYRHEGGKWTAGNAIPLDTAASEIVMAVGADGKVMIITEDAGLRNITYLTGDAGVTSFTHPTLTAAPMNPTFTENGAAADLFGDVVANTNDAGQVFESLALTVSNVTDAGKEFLIVDGGTITLVNGYAGTLPNGISYTVALTGGTATVMLTGMSLDNAGLSSLIDDIGYRNTSDAPGTQNRVITLTSIADSGSSNNVTALNISSTVAVSPVNDPPSVSLQDGMTVGEDGMIALTGISIGDVDGDAGSFTLDLTTHEGDFSVSAHPGITTTLSLPGHVIVQGSMADLKALISSGGITLTPSANFHGTLNLTVNFGDGDDLSTDTTAIVVTPVADTPTVTSTTVAEDGMSASGLVISPSVADGAEVTHFLITGITGGTLYLANGTTPVSNGQYITVSEGLSGLRFKPAPDQNGSSGFDFNVQASVGMDGTKLSTAVAAAITVTEVNDAPIAVDDVLPSMAEDSSAIVIPFAQFLANDSAGPLEAGQTLTITAVSDAIGGTVQIVGGNLVFTPTPDFHGQASFKYAVTDNGTTNGVADPKTATGTVSFNVTPGADTPTVMSVTTDEDTQSGAIVISRSPVDGSEVTHFKITGVTGGTLYLNDGVTIVANGSFITSAHAQAGLKFTPSPDSTDQGSFQVQASTSASDAGLGGSTVTATIDVNPVNDAPVLADLDLSLTATEGAGTPEGLVGMAVADLLAGFLDVDAGSLRGIAVTYAGTSDGTFWYSTDDGANWYLLGASSQAEARLIGEVGGRIYFQPKPGFDGTVPAGLGFRAWDMTSGTNGGTADVTTNGGQTAFSTAVETVTIVIAPVNDAPALTVPDSVEAREDVLTSVTGIQVSDPDAGSGIVTVTLTAASGYLFANAGGGVSVSGTGTGSMTLTGTVANINSYIAASNVAFQSSTNVHGTVKMQVEVSDNGNTGVGGARTDEAEFDIVVSPVNDAPISADGEVTLLEDGSYTFRVSDFAFADPNDAAAPNALMSVVIDSLPVRGTLTLNGVSVSAGAVIALADIIGGKLVYTPGSNENGSGYASFTFRVKDDGGTADGGADTSAQHEISIDVTAVNDAAVIVGDLTGSVKEDDVTTVSGSLTVTDIEAGEALFQPMAAVEGVYGLFSFDHVTGTWTYVLDNASSQVQALREGEMKHETFTVTSLDGTEKVVTVTVVGSKDAEVIDGIEVDRTETTNLDGSVSQVVTIPVVSAGRAETDGSAQYADIPLVTAAGRTLLTVQVGVGIGLTASGFAAPKAAGASLADLIREIQAHTAAGSADRGTLSGGGSSFLAGLAAGTPLIVQALTLSQAGAVSGVPLVISGDSSAQAPATALVIDARGLAAGTVIALDNVSFATILGAVRVTGGAGSQVVYGDGAAQHIVLGADDDTLHGGGGNDFIGSKGGHDWLYGDAGNDTVAGGIGNDHLYGGSGHDRLLGEAGHDRLYGEAGNDRLDGGAGNDTLWGGSGHDRLDGGSGHDRLDGGSGNDRLDGGSGNDTLVGGSGHDRLSGGSGHDRLDGGAGNDVLKGEAGHDRLVGGLGRDKMWGGAGNDIFVFSTVPESRVGAQRDVIYDFQTGHDRIDLRGIDANTGVAGNQAFAWTGADGPFLHPKESAAFLAAGFTGRAGELRLAHGILMGDVDGDGRADFEIRIIGPLAAGDVIL